MNHDQKQTETQARPNTFIFQAGQFHVADRGAVPRG
jgi:hypothetical protein